MAGTIVRAGAPLAKTLEGRLLAGQMQTDGLALDFDAYCSALRTVQAMEDNAGWWLGDLLLWAEGRFGEEYAQAIGELEYEKATAIRSMWICRRYPPIRRRIGGHLRFAHYECVTATWITDDLAQELLDQCESNRWSKHLFRQIVQSWKGRNKVPQSAPQATPPAPIVTEDPEEVETALVTGPPSTNGRSPLARMQAPEPPALPPPATRSTPQTRAPEVLPPEQTAWAPGMRVAVRIPPVFHAHRTATIIGHHYKTGMAIVDTGDCQVYVLRNWADMRRPEGGSDGTATE